METDRGKGPWHAGEEAMQGSVGAVDRMREIGPRVIRDHMPDQHRDFYESLPFVILGSVAGDGTPFASMIVGEPGFMSTPDARTIHLVHNLPPHSPAASGLVLGASVGLLGIELHTRRRNRVNGTITAADGNRLTIAVEHSYGNCPKYIQLRDIRDDAGEAGMTQPQFETGTRLTARQRELIGSSDTLFVATYVDTVNELGSRKRQVDVSHRGGRPGFIQVADDDTLNVPDFLGNNFFNTLGNLALNPRAGLLFIDFDTGATTQVEGSTEIILAGSTVDGFPGAERIWTVRPRRIDQSLAAAASLRFTTRADGLSPYLRETGTWAAGKGEHAPSAAWSRLRVARIQDETADVRSIYLAAMDGSALPQPRPGQHLSLRLPGREDRPGIVKTYTISSPPNPDYYRISVKRQGPGSTAVHQLAVGDELAASRPSGDFVLPRDLSGELIFLAGGIGITPVLAMLFDLEARIAAGETVGRATVIYAVRTIHDLALIAEVQAVCSRLAGRIQLIRLVSRPPGEHATAPYEATGRLRGALLADCRFTETTRAFACGPTGFMEAAKTLLISLGLRDENFHAETFGFSQYPKGFSLANGCPTPASGPLRIRFARSGIEATWETGKGTLLQFAETLGLQPAFDCRAGNCGTCRTRLISGQVHGPATAKTGNSPAEVLICCSSPGKGTGILVLDV